ncbi:MAG: UDP-N-acetylmuramate dehydrogenase [Patescibacteria group bacterium]
MADIKTLLNGVQENIPLAPYTTFKIGGPARYFYIAKSAEDVKKAVGVAKELKLLYYIIGNGSNILVSDQGFNGLVIKLQTTNYKLQTNNIVCDSGVILGKLVNEAIKNGLTGVEWMIGIPGTLGGAIYGNAGAFGHTISESVESIEALDAGNLSVKNLSGDECGFGYRRSIFKPKADHPRADKEKKYIILKAVLKLEKGNEGKSRELVKNYLKKRKSRFPLGPSAGSVFKNPLISENQKAFERLAKKYSEAERFRVNGKIPAGWLIEEYGLLGKKIGGAMIFKEHGNFIVNAGGATSEDVIMLICLIKEKIRVNFGIQMEEEIQYVGFGEVKS